MKNKHDGLNEIKCVLCKSADHIKRMIIKQKRCTDDKCKHFEEKYLYI